MNIRHFLLFLSLSLFANSLCNADTDATAAWEYPLYLGNGGIWKQRIPCLIENNTEFDLYGDPISIAIGKGKKKLPLAAALAESIRVTNATGDQLLYRITDSNGVQIEKGPIPIGARLTIPLECDKDETFKCFIYFDNSSAWPVGEYFYTHHMVDNGDFENAGKYGPVSWEIEWAEENRVARWSDSQAHSGKRSLEVSSKKAGDKRSYGAAQSNIHLIPSVPYALEAWFKSEDLTDEAGLELIPASLRRTERDLKFDPIILKAETTEKGWVKANVEFTAPEGSNVLTIGTFIEGSGTLWVDDVRLTCKADYNLQVDIMPIERAPVVEVGETSKWYGNPKEWPLRASITVPNFSDASLDKHPIFVDTEQLRNRLHSEIDENTVIQVTNGVNPIPYFQMGDDLLFREDIAASTFQTFYVYFSDASATDYIQKPDTYGSLSQITDNLVANPGFDDPEISGWERFGETETKLLNLDKDEGNPSARISYTASEEEERTAVHDIETSRTEATDEAEIGLYQTFDVHPDHSYFFSARVKSSNVLERTRTLRVRFLNGLNEFTGDEASLEANPDMYQNNEWVHETMIVKAPTDARSVKIELLNTAEGEVWYDDVFFMMIGNGYTGALALERRAADAIDELVTWQENTIVKVFPDDLPNGNTEKLALSAARNEDDPAQLVLRSPIEYKDLEVRVSPISNKNGDRLDHVEVGVIGYVPVDYPSNFYRDFVTPFWQTRMPSGTIGSDGWAGWWPDPILPVQSFDLPAHKTQSVWIEISVPSDAAPGDYLGSVSLIHKGEILKEIPLEMQVYDFTLPDSSGVSMFDVRFNEREMFGSDTTEQEKYEEIWEFMKEHRIGPETIRPEPEFKLVDGEVVVDFTEFDKAAVHYFDEFNFRSTYTPWILYSFGWGHPPKEFLGEKPYPGEPPYYGVDRSKLRPEYVKTYQSALRQYWEHMKEMGWADKVIMYMSDEPHADAEMVLQTKTVCDMIHEVDPNIPIYISTWWYRPEFEGYVDLWGVSHRGGGWGHPVPVEHLEQIRKNGGEVIFTTDGMVCMDTPYIGFERLIPYFCFKYGAKEYENWAANWQTLNPYEYGWHRYHRQYSSEEVKYWMKYPNGAGTMIYPGPPIGVDHLVAATRLKQVRDGVEDYEYMKRLDELINQQRSEGKNVEQAQKALDRALSLVNIPSADGRYTTGYVSDPDEILDIRHEMATAIEALSH